MTAEQKAAHEKRIDEFLAVARRSFIEHEAEPVICLGINRNGKIVQILEDTAPPSVVGTALNSAIDALHDRVFFASHSRWIKALERNEEFESLKAKAQEVAAKINEKPI